MSGKLYRYGSQIFAKKIQWKQQDLVTEAIPFKGIVSVTSYDLFTSQARRIDCIIVDSSNPFFNNCNVRVDRSTIMHYVFENGLIPAKQTSSDNRFHISGDFDWYWGNFCRPTLKVHNV